MNDDTTKARATQTPEQAAGNGTTRRVFLDRLRKTATVAVPVIAAIALTPSKAIAGS